MDRAEFEDYKRLEDRVQNWATYAVLGGAVAIGFAVAESWSTIGGAATAVLLFPVGWQAQRRWSKARWIRRFPELGDPRHWRRPT